MSGVRIRSRSRRRRRRRTEEEKDTRASKLGALAHELHERFAITGNDEPHLPSNLAKHLQHSQRPASIIRSNHDHHPDPAVERPQHLVIGNIPLLLQPMEHGRPTPTGYIDDRLGIHRQHARNVLRQPAIRDMRQCQNLHLVQQPQNRPKVLASAEGLW